MMFGFGNLNKAQALILDRIEAGEDISIDEFYGAGISKNGFKQLDAILNSKKLVYFDGKTFLKMSAFTLTKALTSDPKSNFQTTLPGREDMHNLRLLKMMYVKKCKALKVTKYYQNDELYHLVVSQTASIYLILIDLQIINLFCEYNL